MTKDKLEIGMVVELKNKEKYVVTYKGEDKLILTNLNKSVNMFHYDNNLRNTTLASHDIDRIYKMNAPYSFTEMFEHNLGLTLYWERPIYTVTREEIAKAFNIPLDKLKIAD